MNDKMLLEAIQFRLMSLRTRNRDLELENKVLKSKLNTKVTELIEEKKS